VQVQTEIVREHFAIEDVAKQFAIACANQNRVMRNLRIKPVRAEYQTKRLIE